MTGRRTALGLAVATSAALLVTLGCQVLPPAWGPLLATPPRGEAVTITGPAGDSAAGRAAVVGADLVLTVRHVLPAAGLLPADGVEAWVSTGRGGGGRAPGRVVGAIPARPEPVLVVRVDVDDGPLAALVGFSGFSPDRRYVMGAGPPEQVETARGRAPLLRARLRPGDSGSPVLDASGGLVGLLCGVRDGVPAFAPIRPADLRPYERRRPPAPAPIDLIARAWPGAARGPRGP